MLTRLVVTLCAGMSWTATRADVPRHDDNVKAAQPDRKLTVSVFSTCEAMLPAYCQGKFGFQATADGKFLVGPRPDGRSVSGHLREAESRELRSAAMQVLAGVDAPSVECHFRMEIPGAEEKLVVSTGDRTILLRGLAGRLGQDCAPGDAIADANLFDLADRLMRRYYPKPF